MVYVRSSSIVLFNGIIYMYDKISLIFFNCEVIPIFALKRSIFRHQSQFRVIACLVLWRNHRGTLSRKLIK